MQNLVTNTLNRVSSTISKQNADDSEMIMNYETRISDLMLTIQKQERDIAYKEVEFNSIKNIAREVAE